MGKKQSLRSKRRALRQRFYNDLLSNEPDTPASEILEQYTGLEQKQVRSFIFTYFFYISRKIDFTENVINFGPIGTRLFNFVRTCGFFKPKTVNKFTRHFGQYEDSSLNMDKLDNIIKNIARRQGQKNATSSKLSSQIDYKITGFKQIDAK